MKRILIIAVVIFLAIYGYSKYREHQRFQPPSSYDYEISQQVDGQYHNPSLVSEYYQLAQQVGQYARSVWSSKRIDVRHPKLDDPEHQLYAEKYQLLISRAKELEEALETSQSLKDQGFNNQDIRRMETEGLSPQYYRVIAALGSTPVRLQRGDQGQLVYWVQEKLIALEYSIPLDGVFAVQTQEALIDFQKKHNLAPTGMVDSFTMQKLFETSP